MIIGHLTPTPEDKTVVFQNFARVTSKSSNKSKE